MKKLLLTAAVLSLVGCQTTGTSAPQRTVKPTTPVVAKTCDFDSLPGTEYVFGETLKVAPSVYIRKQSYSGSFVSDYSASNHKDARFKFTGEDIEASYGEKLIYRVNPHIIDEGGKNYRYDNLSYGKVVSSKGCKEFWFKRDTPYASPKLLVRADGQKLTFEDAKEIQGADNFKAFVIPPAKVEYDKYRKTTKIVGDYDRSSGILLRTWKDGNVKPKHVQIYADVLIFDDWAHFKNAYTVDGKRRKLTRIDTDVNCGSGSCRLTETVGVDVPVSLLKKNPKGFTVLLSGTREKEILIRGYQVKQMLDTLKTL